MASGNRTGAVFHLYNVNKHATSHSSGRQSSQDTQAGPFEERKERGVLRLCKVNTFLSS